MKSYLQTKTIHVEGLGEITIRELSTKGQNELSKVFENEATRVHLPALACKLCVPEWENDTVEDIEANVGVKALADLMRAIYEYSRIETVAAAAGQTVNGEDRSAKKADSATTPAESSSIG